MKTIGLSCTRTRFIGVGQMLTLDPLAMMRTIISLIVICALAGCATVPEANVSNANISNSTVPNANNPEANPLTAVVSIHGLEVRNSGSYSWQRGMTLLDIIKAAGGLSEFADYAHLRITHLDGTIKHYKYAKLRRGDTKDPLLQPGDRVYVSNPYF